ncbi:RNA-directed DNA polymerase from transposon X-element [Elysia marginata]|uniref:RNA-directed DNA polymerase from transposon X-element n=1 Tax=Elysia marginata TaxID=1093978 RepID=A0AAV4EAE0_9GAST|nr:RNA-directed DNA polymerase from transposon X-element [Elysia marginata]
MAPRTKVVLVWIPSQVGIPRNEKVDELAKLALNKEVHNDKQVIWSDLKLKLNTNLEQLWQTDWDTEVDNKLHEIRPNLKERLYYDELAVCPFNEQGGRVVLINCCISPKEKESIIT